jgi:hypothetical protein
MRFVSCCLSTIALLALFSIAAAQQGEPNAKAEKAPTSAASKSPPEWVKTIGPTITITKPEFSNSIGFVVTPADFMNDSGATTSFQLPMGTVRTEVRILFKGKQGAVLGIFPQSTGSICKAKYDHLMSLGLFGGDYKSASVGKKYERQAIKAGDWIGIYHDQDSTDGLAHREYYVYLPEHSYQLRLSWPDGSKEGKAEAEKQVQFFLWSCETKDES